MNMQVWYTTRIVDLLKQAQAIGEKHGHKYILRSGLIREIIISSALGHYVHTEMHQHDAYNPDDPEEVYEYITSFDSGTQFSFSSMRKGLDNTKNRILRNKWIYFVTFDDDNPMEISEIYRLCPQVVWNRIDLFLKTRSKKYVGSVKVSKSWVRKSGHKVI